MAVNKKNLRVCEILDDGTTYDVLVAVTTLDEIDNILQEWALATLSHTIDLPSALISNVDITEKLTSVMTDEFVYLDSAVSAYMDMPRFAGMTAPVALPLTLVDGKYVVPAGSAFFYSLTGFLGYFGEYTIESESFTLSAGVNYIGATFNSGVPIFQIYSAFSSFDYSTTFPIATVLNFGSQIFNIPFGATGYGLAEKQVQMIGSRKKFEILDTFTLGATTQYVELSAMDVSTGINTVSCDAMDTGDTDNDMYLFYRDASQVWQNVKVTQIDNAQYQSNAGLANLVAGEFVANNIFRVVCGDNLLIYTTLSNKFASLAAAKESEIPTDLPDMIKATAVFVGRMIIEQGVTTPVVQKVQAVTLATAG